MVTQIFVKAISRSSTITFSSPKLQVKYLSASSTEVEKALKSGVDRKQRFFVINNELAFLLHRKEVIQPQVPLRLPCYDFIPVTSLTLGYCFNKVSAYTSGATGFHDVTGGVYKTRERIHAVVADTALLAIPTSWRRVAASNPNWAQFCRFPPPRGIGSHCAGHCSTCAALGVRAILT